MAVRCLGSLVGKVLLELLEDEDGEVQNLIIGCLGPQVSQVLLKLLGDKDGGV